MNEHLLSMFRHMKWSDRKLLEAFQSVSNPPPEALKLYAHIIGAEGTWLARIEGREPAFGLIWPDWDKEACASNADTIVAGYERLFDQPHPADLSRDIVYRNSKGIEFRTALSDILIHVFLHGSYHRGQINSRLRGAGVEPIAFDYITFVRE